MRAAADASNMQNRQNHIESVIAADQHAPAALGFFGNLRPDPHRRIGVTNYRNEPRRR